MTSRKPTDWMWARASDLLDQAERMHRQMFRISAPGRDHAIWEPPVDVFEDEHELIVVIALPGVRPEQVEIVPEPGYLLVSANRPIPFAGARRAVWRLEIPYGRFERRVSLPAGGYHAVGHEFRDGLLVLHFDKAATG